MDNRNLTGEKWEAIGKRPLAITVPISDVGLFSEVTVG
jgi:hypothetical protein